MTFTERLKAVVPAGQILLQESMALHTTFRIGGPADYFVIPADAQELSAATALCRQECVPFYIIGNGSNLLVGDGGFRGVIFCICRSMDEVELEGREDGRLYVTAGAGVMLSRLARQVSEYGYTGFEYATGIPGTLGGGVTMNAGAYGGEIKDALLWAEVMDSQGQILRLEKDALDLGYRHSIIMEKEYIVLKAAFAFEKGDSQAIDARVQELSTQRKEKQPLEYPSAGSTFKRPEGYFAGKLIQDCGLKGFHVGDAEVSVKHSGFVINKGSAKAADVMALIDHVQQQVFDTFGVRIEPEIRMIGEF